MKASFVSFLHQKYPQLNPEQLNTTISENLLSPFQIGLSQDQVEKIQSEIKSYWKLRNWGEQNISADYEKFGLAKPNNYSACMSYDFHINSEGAPELIEINTNASFLALGLELYDYLKLPLTPRNFDEQALIQMFKDEASLSNKNSNSIAIVDENPSKQRLYLEFLVYNELFRKHGIDSRILDFREIEKIKNYSLVYNRYTDFYLQAPQSTELKSIFNEKQNFSPNPYEYFLLADKQRLLDWNLQKDIEKPTSLLAVYDLGKSEKEKIWQERKSLFIKPKNSFGGKQAYKAGSISHKVFDEIFNENFIAQKLSTPSEVEVNYEGQNTKFKYDLRCFAYKDNLQLIIARLYQGQTTNLKTPGGGFAAIRIS